MCARHVHRWLPSHSQRRAHDGDCSNQRIAFTRPTQRHQPRSSGPTADAQPEPEDCRLSSLISAACAVTMDCAQSSASCQGESVHADIPVIVRHRRGKAQYLSVIMAACPQTTPAVHCYARLETMCTSANVHVGLARPKPTGLLIRDTDTQVRTHKSANPEARRPVNIVSSCCCDIHGDTRVHVAPCRCFVILRSSLASARLLVAVNAPCCV